MDTGHAFRHYDADTILDDHTDKLTVESSTVGTLTKDRSIGGR